MKRQGRVVVLLVFAVACTLLLGNAVYQDRREKNEKQNYLVIAIDDLKNLLGPSKPDPLITTNLDKLVGDSVFFENAQSNGVSCNPSRISMWTGLRPISSGITDNQPIQIKWRDYLRRPRTVGLENYNQKISKIKTLYQHFRDNGYYIGAAGKVFHSKKQQQKEPWHYEFSKKNKYHFLSVKENVYNYPLNGLDELVSTNTHALMDWGPIEKTMFPGKPGKEEKIDDYEIATHTINAISQSQKKGMPFMIGSGFIRPHLPLYNPQRIIDKYDFLEDIDAREFVAKYVKTKANDQADVPFTLDPSQKDVEHILSKPEVWKDLIVNYWASMTYVDEQIGRVIDHLKATDQYDNTTIVLWSDHGYALGEKQSIRKGTLWRESTDIPLAVKMPDSQNSGNILDAPVSSIDIFPTLVDIGGLDMPADYPRDGRSFARLLRDPTAPWPWYATSDMTMRLMDNNSLKLAKVLRNNDEAFIRYNFYEHELDPQLLEYYDLANDPYQWNNLLHENYSPSMQQKIQKLNAIIEGQALPDKPPTAIEAAYEVPRNGRQEFTVYGNDPNLDYLEFSIDTLPRHGRLSVVTGDGEEQLIFTTGRVQNTSADGLRLVYYSYNKDDSFDFSVSDGRRSSSASAVLNVQ